MMSDGPLTLRDLEYILDVLKAEIQNRDYSSGSDDMLLEVIKRLESAIHTDAIKIIRTNGV